MVKLSTVSRPALGPSQPKKGIQSPKLMKSCFLTFFYPWLMLDGFNQNYQGSVHFDKYACHLGLCGGIVVSILAFYSDNPYSNPAGY